MDYLTSHISLSPIQRGFAPGFINYKKRCTRLSAASDKVYQLLAHGRWFSPNTLASSTTKTGRHDIAESGVKHNKSNQINDIAEKRLTCNQTTMIHSLCYTQSKGDNSVIHNQRETTLLYTIKGRQTRKCIYKFKV